MTLFVVAGSLVGEMSLATTLLFFALQKPSFFVHRFGYQLCVYFSPFILLSSNCTRVLLCLSVGLSCYLTEVWWHSHVCLGISFDDEIAFQSSSHKVRCYHYEGLQNILLLVKLQTCSCVFNLFESNSFHYQTVGKLEAFLLETL